MNTGVISNTVNTVQNATNNLKKTASGRIMYVIIVAVIIIMGIYLLLSLRRNFLDYTVESPWIVLNTIDARKNALAPIPGKNFMPSNDEKFGLEFTYSTWIYIRGFELKRGDAKDFLKHIMHKGSQITNYKVLPVLQCPGLWLDSYDNSMKIYFNTFNDHSGASGTSGTSPPLPVETITISNLPVKKWFNIVISVINRDVDVYINGRLKERKRLKGLPRQNYGPVFVAQNNGFDGYLSRFRYFSEALPYYRIENIMRDGPSQVPIPELGEMPPYLANDYWLETD